MEEVGASVQEEVDALKAKLLDASEVNQVGEVLQQENDALRREVLQLRENVPSIPLSFMWFLFIYWITSWY